MYVSDLMGYFNRIQKRTINQAREKLMDYYMLVVATNSEKPDEVAKSLNASINKLEELDGGKEVENTHPQLYPDTDLDALDKLKSMRQTQGLQ